ncbi:MAG: hypothetical protein L0Y75_04520, partial [Acidobacteria bacterium]|nr:hypothetical protein [Acidobacteriota bacterium]
MDQVIQRLLSIVPDQPKWVELRGMLLSGLCEVDGLEDAERLSFVARHAETDLVFAYGRPASDVIRQVVARQSSSEAVLCLPEDRGHVAEAVPEWRSELATIYRLTDGGRLPEV